MRKKAKKPIRRKRRPINRPRRALRAPSVYRFKREVDELVALAGVPESWTANSDNSLSKVFAYALNSVGDYTDFQHLFKYYRIKGARVRMYFSNTGSDTIAANYNSANKQIMVQIDRNMDGTGVPTIETLLTSQTKKRFIALQGTRKPSVDIYMPLKQSTDMFGTAGAPTALVSPKWLNTADTEAAGVPHYGLSINLGRVDKSVFTTGLSNNQYVRIITTLYIECKKVQ